MFSWLRSRLSAALGLYSDTKSLVLVIFGSITLTTTLGKVAKYLGRLVYDRLWGIDDEGLVELETRLIPALDFSQPGADREVLAKKITS